MMDRMTFLPVHTIAVVRCVAKQWIMEQSNDLGTEVAQFAPNFRITRCNSKSSMCGVVDKKTAVIGNMREKAFKAVIESTTVIPVVAGRCIDNKRGQAPD
jgi:hypothetical protein